MSRFSVLLLSAAIQFVSQSAMSATIEDYQKQYRNLPCEGVKSKYIDVKKRKKNASGEHKKELSKQLTATKILIKEKC